MTLRRFFRTPKGLLLVVLVPLALLAALAEPWPSVVTMLSAAVVGAAAVDVIALRLRRKRWVFPDGAILTGLIVAMILSPQEPWYVAAITAAIGVASKYALRVRKANLLNPAAVGLVATFYVFNTGQSWWGALADSPAPLLGALLAAGIFITQRVNKLPAILSFLGSYYLLFTIAAFLGDAARVAELYRAPDLHAALFFAFFMVTDPPTSPPKSRDQILFGALTGVTSFAAFELVGAAYFLLAGLLVANVWEGARRARVRPAKSPPNRAVVARA